MMKLDITSITISELSLVLLFVFIIFYAHDSISDAQNKPTEDVNLEELRQEVIRLNEEVLRLNTENLQLKNDVAGLNTKVASLEAENLKLQEERKEFQDKKSKQLPSCKEKGVSDDWFAEIEMVGDQYRILKDNNGIEEIDPQKLYSIKDIRYFYKDLVGDYLKNHQCKQSILIKADESLNVRAYNRLKMLFYEKTITK
jgi:hypothetical protein